MLQRKPTPAAITHPSQSPLSCQHIMAQLLSLPEELITQIYTFAGENNRALVRLSGVNRQLRALWLQDSDYIIAQSLELKAPGHQDAIALTLIEACCPMPVSGFHRVNASKDDPSLRLHLSGLRMVWDNSACWRKVRGACCCPARIRSCRGSLGRSSQYFGITRIFRLPRCHWTAL